MNDITNHSFGQGTSPWNTIRASLAEMERRLGELQDQLDPRPGAPGFTQALQGSAVAGGAPTAILDTAAVGGAVGVGFVPPPFGSDPAARQNAEEIVAQARAVAREVLASAEAQVGLVKEQIEQLLQARETLRGSLRTTLTECESALGRLEHGENPPAHPPSEVATSITPADFARAPVRPSVFEGTVALRVGPLRDISQVDTLEIALLQVPGAEAVEVKEFAGRDAVAIIKLFQPVPLVEELRRVLPFQFEVAEVGADALTLNAIEDSQTGWPNDPAGSTSPAEAE